MAGYNGGWRQKEAPARRGVTGGGGGVIVIADQDGLHDDHLGGLGAGLDDIDALGELTEAAVGELAACEVVDGHGVRAVGLAVGVDHDVVDGRSGYFADV